MAWGDILYQLAREPMARIDARIVAKLKNCNGTLNSKEIRFISDVYHIQVNGRPDNETRARIIKVLTGETIPVRGRGNPGTARERERDIQLAEAFTVFRGTRADFYRKQSVKFADSRNIDRALLRGECYIREDADKHHARIIELQEKISGLEGYMKLLEIVKEK